MPYPKHLLNNNETITIDTRPHWWYFSRHILLSIPVVVLFVLWAIQDGGVGRTTTGYIFAVVALVWLVYVGWAFMQWRFTYFVVTNQRVIYRTGVVARKGTEIPLERINNINFSQRLFERIIGAGDLDIESAGRDGQTHFENVNHPDGIQQEIYKQMETDAKERASWIGKSAADHTQAGVAPAPTPAPSVSIAEQIKELGALHDAGHLTDAQYESKKQELLDRM